MIFSYPSDWSIGRHKAERPRLEGAREPSGRTSTHWPSKDYDVFLIDVHIVQYKLIEVLSIFLEFLFSGCSVAFILAVAWILHTDHVYVAKVFDLTTLILSQDQVFGVPVEVYQDFWRLLIPQVQGWYIGTFTFMYLFRFRFIADNVFYELCCCRSWRPFHFFLLCSCLCCCLCGRRYRGIFFHSS